MYNSDMPTRAELPSSAQLFRSTIIALIAAAAILVTIVLPAEYGIDPTGIGRMLRLTEMGEIKKQLAEEAERDRIRDAQQSQSSPQSSLAGKIFALIIPSASAQTANRSDQTTITLKPSEGIEWKMTMIKAAKVDYSWSASGGPVNYDMHGSPKGGGKESSYKAQRGVTEDKGVLTAGFDGSHGWFFRNRGSATITVILRTSGAYTDLKRVN